MGAVKVCARAVSAVPSPFESKSASTPKTSLDPSPLALSHSTFCAAPPSMIASMRTKSALSVPLDPPSANLAANDTDAHEEISIPFQVRRNGSRPPSPSRSCATRNGAVKPK
eukprot:7388832-Prymnesium_polylepis.1